jgi:hypothetical protein
MKPQPKTVRAWCYAYSWGRNPYISDAFMRKVYAVEARRARKSPGCFVGPVVRIEVPAPKERR